MTTLEEAPARVVGIDPALRGHCQTCGVAVRANRYYCDEHRPTPKPRTRKRSRGKRLTPEQAAASPEPVREAIRDVAEGARPSKRPSVEATNKLLSKLLYYAFLLVVMSVVSSDTTLSEEEKQQTSAGLALSDEDAAAITHPFARMLTPTAIWQRVGSGVLENSDFIDALVALYDAASGLMRYRRERARREARLRAMGPTANGQAPFAAPAPAPAAPIAIPEGGVMPSPEVIAEIRRRHGQETS